MKRSMGLTALVLAVMAAGCSREGAALEIRPARDAAPAGDTATASRNTAAARERRETPASAGVHPGTGASASRSENLDVTIPAGTMLPLELVTGVGSDTSRVEDQVRATLRRPVIVDGVQALPAGSVVVGAVTAAGRSARVRGLARVAFRFTAVTPRGEPERVTIRTDTVSRRAPATKKEDAAKIGGGAAGGAIVGGILGGGDGAVKGAVIGGAAGTGLVLSTRGGEVRLSPGASLTVRLAAPVTIHVPASGG